MERFTANLTPFPTRSKEERLMERAKVVAHNFYDPDLGLILMAYMLAEMQSYAADIDNEFISFSLAARLHEAASYLEYLQKDE